MIKKVKSIFNTDIDMNYSEAPPEINSEEFLKVIRSRRSVRVYTEEKVKPEDMQTILESALLAPTSSNLQSWKFVWVKDEEKKKKLAKYCLNQAAAKTAAELVVCVARTKTWKKNAKDLVELMENDAKERGEEKLPSVVYQYYKKIVPYAYSQGLLGSWGLLKKIFLNIRGLTTVTPREPTSEAQMRTWAAKTTALGCQNMMLTARALGYDSCPMEGFDSVRVNKLIKSQKGDFPIMVISFGQRSEKGVYGPQYRLEKDRFIEII